MHAMSGWLNMIGASLPQINNDKLITGLNETVTASKRDGLKVDPLSNYCPATFLITNPAQRRRAETSLHSLSNSLVR